MCPAPHQVGVETIATGRPKTLRRPLARAYRNALTPGSGPGCLHTGRSPRQRLSCSYECPPSAGENATARRKACANTSTASLFVVRYSAAT